MCFFSRRVWFGSTISIHDPDPGVVLRSLGFRQGMSRIGMPDSLRQTLIANWNITIFSRSFMAITINHLFLLHQLLEHTIAIGSINYFYGHVQ